MTPIEIMDDLLAEDLRLSLAIEWYGDKAKLISILLHLKKDGYIEIYNLKENTKEIVEIWKVEKLLRNILSCLNIDKEIANIYFGLTEKGLKDMGY